MRSTRTLTTAILLATAIAAAPLGEAIHTSSDRGHATQLAGSKPGMVGDGKSGQRLTPARD
jgi:hypothetical protein